MLTLFGTHLSTYVKKPLYLLKMFCLLISSVTVILIASACSNEIPPPTPSFTEASANDGTFNATDKIMLAPKGLWGFFNRNYQPTQKVTEAERDKMPILRSGEILEEGHHYKVTGLPQGLTVTVKAFGENVEVFLGGKAEQHAVADSKSVTTIDFTKGYIWGCSGDCSLYTIALFPVSASFLINFSDNVTTPTLTYSGFTLSESSSNDGSMGNSLTIDMTDDSFAQSTGTLTKDTHYTITGTAIPTGLSPVVTVNSANQVTFSLSGNAAPHTSAQNVTGVTLTFLAAAFTKAVVPTNGSVSKSISVGFSDPAFPTLAYSAISFAENGANAGGISATVDATVSSDVWSISSGDFTLNTHYTLTGTAVPSGLTPVLTRIDATTARLSFTGNAASHANSNDVSGITVNFLGAAFTNGNAPTNGTQSQNFAINFNDPYGLSYSATSFLENTSNAGGISETVDVTLSNDTWSIASGAFTLNTHYTLTGTAVPAGLTAVVTRMSSTVGRLSFTGAASSHSNANDVSGITLTFLGAAFTGGTAPSNGSQAQNFSINFSDSNILLYSAGTYNGNLGGRTGADALCDAQRPTGYRTNARAFISVSSADELQDMDVLYSIPNDQEVVSSSGTPMASDWADLIDGTIDANLLAAGILLMPNSWWSGSDNTGALSTNHCNGWTDDSSVMPADGAFGTSIVDSNWIFVSDVDCATELELLCVAFQ